MRLSIISVHFNDLNGLLQTAKSISLQLQPSEMEIEWIIQDAGTTGFYEWLQSNGDIFSMAKIESHPDLGIYDGMNQAVSRATGTFAIFMNSGDEFFGTSALLAFMEDSKNDADLYLGAAGERVPGCQIRFKFPRRSIWALRYGMPTHHQAIFYRRSLLLRFPFELKYRIAADYDQLLRIVYSGGARFRYSDEVVCVFNLDGISSTAYWKAHFEQSRVRIERGVSSRLVELSIIMLKAVVRMTRRALPFIYARVRYASER